MHKPTERQRKTLTKLARNAMLYLAGESEPYSVSLKDYDHSKYGPYLGVSDEGSAAHIIRKAALASPKMQAVKSVTPIIAGVAHDAERLGAIGEVPVGPEEYVDIRLECMGRILTSTNVGTRLNLRYYKRSPVIVIEKGYWKKTLAKAKHSIEVAFEPFLHPPGGKPRPLTVFVEFDRESRRSIKDRIKILRQLTKFVSKGEIADRGVHQLGFQIRIGYGYKGRNAVLLAIDMASAAGIQEVAVDGVVRKEADVKVSLPGLLNYLAPGLVGPILRKAREKEIRIRPKNTVDPDTVARNIWTSLNSARHMGLELGKYGTFPLTLGECDEVIRQVQHWFKDWTAAPVFFVDQGIISNKKVYVGHDVVAGLREWLKIIKRHKVPVVLIDTVDKSKGWRLLRVKSDLRGLLSPKQIQSIDKLASQWGIKVLWAGGITLPQAYEFGKMGVFGIYVTSAAASKGPVSEEYERAPLLASLKEPAVEGVLRAKMLLEAGFLVTSLKGTDLEKELEDFAHEFIKVFNQHSSTKTIRRAQQELFLKTIAAWKVYLKNTSRRKIYSSGAMLSRRTQRGR